MNFLSPARSVSRSHPGNFAGAIFPDGARASLLACLIFALGALRLQAQTAQRVYEFNGAYAETNGGPAMVPNGGTLGATGYAFAISQGPAVSNALANAGEYSIETVFRIDAVSGYRSLLNFNNLSADNAVYCRDGGVLFYNYSSGATSTSDLVAGQTHRLVVTRNATTKVTTAYVDGVQKAQVTDVNDYYVASATNGIVHFFRDNGSEHPSGFVDQIRIYHSVLTPAQVSALGGATNSWQAVVNAGNPAAIYFTPVAGASPVAVNVGSFAPGSARSFEFVFNAAGAGPSKTLLGSQSASSGAQYLKLNQFNNTGRFGLTTAGVADYVFANSPTLSNQRVHAVFTSNGTVTTLYLNGVAQSGVVNEGLKISGRNGLGAVERTTQLAFEDNLDGTITGFASYARALTQAEVTARYNAIAGIVPNATPVVAVTAPASVSTPEGSAPTKTGIFSDADGNATVTLTASAGTVTPNAANGIWSWTGPVADGPVSSTITITATDAANAVATATFTSTITNVAPIVTISAPATANEDAAVSFSFTAADPSTADQSAGFAWSINYGDGSAAQNIAAGTASPLARTYTYANPGTYTVTATATDKNAGVSTTATRSITINAVNALPEINLKGGGNSIPDGDLVPSTAKLTRFGSVATSLVRTFTIENIGSGPLTVSAITVSGENASEFAVSGAPSSVAAGANATFTVTYTPTAGVPTSRATITVNSNDANEAAYDFVVEGEKTYPALDTAWTIRSGAAAGNWASITYGGGQFVAVDAWTNHVAATSPDGKTWTIRNPSVLNRWTSVTYGLGRFVAVSQTGTQRVMTSTDGVTWTGRNAAENQGWLSVTYGNGLFVAVANSGPNNVMTSPDGITWTARSTNEAGILTGVTYGNGLFVAVGISGANRFWSSPDGITWTPRSTSQNNWYSVAYGKGMFVAVADYGSVATSADGITWTLGTAPQSNLWRSVAYGAGQFVAVALDGNNRVMTSPDGVTWTLGTSPEANQWIGVAYGEGSFVAMSYQGTNRVMTLSEPVPPEINLRANAMSILDGDVTPSSADHTHFGAVAASLARTFTIENTGGGPLTIGSITVSGENASEFVVSGAPSSVAVGASATFTVTYTPTAGVGTSRATITVNSNDSDEAAYDFVIEGEKSYPASGTQWTSRAATGATVWRRVTYGNGLFVAVGDTAGPWIMTSPDGATWTARTPPTGDNWSAVTWGNGRFVAVAYNSANIATSPDGITWTLRTAPSASGWGAITCGNGVYVAVAFTGTQRVMRSVDGVTWTAHTPSEPKAWLDVAYGNGLFVAIANSGTGNDAMTSPDGITWTARGGGGSSITYGNGRFVTVQASSAQTRTSPDGIAWTSTFTAESNLWTTVTYGNGLFVAVSSTGTNRVMTSPDGATWTARAAAQANTWFGVAYGQGKFVAVSGNGTNRVMTSSPDLAAVVADWATSQGLSGPAALPGATPFGDGVPNLLKYAFNMPLDGPRANPLVAPPAPGANGLPVFTPQLSGPTPTLRAQFLRRKNSGLNYVPQRSASLTDPFTPMLAPQIVTPIDTEWELVTVDEPLGLPVPPTFFTRVHVALP